MGGFLVLVSGAVSVFMLFSLVVMFNWFVWGTLHEAGRCVAPCVT